MIKFRTIRYGHYRQAYKLFPDGKLDMADIETQDKIVNFAKELVTEWDFIDPDTKEPVPLSVGIVELTIEQVTELLDWFNTTFKAVEVPKASGELSSSILTP